MNTKPYVTTIAILAMLMFLNGCDGHGPNFYQQVPTVITEDITDITPYTAAGGGKVIHDGGYPVTERGLAWSIEKYPTRNDNYAVEGSGLGSFTGEITGLQTVKRYYVRAYATNSKGTVYGNQVYFTTGFDTGSVTDIDGNEYKTVKIGEQWWMAENLKTTRYNYGEPIEYTGEDFHAWREATTGMYTWYKNDYDTYGTVYGALYNWFAVGSGSNGGRNICPEGWHVPDYDEWETLLSYLTGISNVGGVMKTTGTIEEGDGLWFDPNLGATNESGWSGLPGGYRWGGRGRPAHLISGGYGSLGMHGRWWSRTEGEQFDTATCVFLGYHSHHASLSWAFRRDGASVRCLKD